MSDGPCLFDAEDGEAEYGSGGEDEAPPASAEFVPPPRAARETPAAKSKGKASEPWTPDTVMTFGKYKGQALRDVPVFYLRFLSNYMWEDEKKDYIQDASKELSFFGNKALKYLLDQRLCFHCGEAIQGGEGDPQGHAHKVCLDKKRSGAGQKGSRGGGGGGRGRGSGKPRGSTFSRFNPY